MTDRQVRSMSLSYSKDLAIALIPRTEADIKVDTDEIIEVAKKFYEFIMEEK